MAEPSPGGMGVHFLNVGLVGQPLNLAHPQVLIYEPDHDTLRLVAAEWFVPAQGVQSPPMKGAGDHMPGTQ